MNTLERTMLAICTGILVASNWVIPLIERFAK